MDQVIGSQEKRFKAGLALIVFAVSLAFVSAAAAEKLPQIQAIPPLVKPASAPARHGAVPGTGQSRDCGPSAIREHQPSLRSKFVSCPNVHLHQAKVKASKKKGVNSPQVFLATNEAGDKVEITAARPGELAIRKNIDGSTSYGRCLEPVTPYLASGYDPCAKISFYDAETESTRVPKTNYAEDAEYDSCGKLVDSGKTSEWHQISQTYLESGWVQGHPTSVPANYPHECLGLWTEVYSFTETFSDGETLTDTIEANFKVTTQPIEFQETFGGGNPGGLPCTEFCFGDPVNTSTGEFWDRETDLTLKGRGPEVSLTRTYSSIGKSIEGSKSSPVGRGWSSMYNLYLGVVITTGEIWIHNGNGSWTTFKQTGSGEYLPPPHILASLTHSEAGIWTYTVKRRQVYVFNEAGKLIRMEDLNGNTTSLSYEENLLHSVTNDAGASITFLYDANNLLEEAVASDGRRVSYVHDEEGNLTEVTDVRGGHIHFTYGEKHQLLTKEDADSHMSFTNTYVAGTGVIRSIEDAEGQVTTFFYPSENITQVEHPNESMTEYEYENGVIKRRSEAVGTPQEATWEFEHDPITLGVTEVVDPNRHTRHATYDEYGDQLSAEEGDGNTTSAVYDSLGDVIEATDANGVTTTYGYDKSGNLLSSSVPLDSGTPPTEVDETVFSHEDTEHPEDVTKLTDSEGREVRFEYDEAGNVVAEVDGEGDEATFTYDSLGDLLSAVKPKGNVEGNNPEDFITRFTYDDAGNRLSETDPLGNERTWIYDPDGNCEEATDGNGNSVSFAYDALNRLTNVLWPNEQEERTFYNREGLVEEQADSKGATIYGYDALGHLSSVTDPAGRSTTYEVDPVGNVVGMEAPNEEVTEFSYDPADRLIQADYPGESSDAVYGYDADGNLTTMTDDTGESMLTYSALDQITSITEGDGDRTAYKYDLSGHVTRITYPNEEVVNQSYDGSGRLAGVADWLGNSTKFEYGPDSELLRTVYPESTGESDEFNYDSSGQLIRSQMEGAGGPLGSLEYERDGAGQVSAQSTEGLFAGGNELFEYDASNRLTRAGSETFSYDPANDLVKAPGTSNRYDAGHQIRSSQGRVYRYDPRGERVEASSPTAEFVKEFGSFGGGEGHFLHPAGLAEGPEGDLWIVDEAANRVDHFGPTGEFISSFGSFGSGEGELNRPSDVTLDGSGDLWVADSGNNRIEEFDQEGHYISSFGSEGSGSGEFFEPSSILVDSAGHLWVGDTYNGRVQEFEPSGEYIQSIGAYGTEEGDIGQATDIALKSNGDILVADWKNNRVSEFAANGEFIREFEGSGSGLEHPIAVAVGPEDHIFVASEGGQRIDRFDSEGKPLGHFGVEGFEEAQFSFGWPLGISVSTAGEIRISDTFNGRIQMWQESSGEGLASESYQYDSAGNLVSVYRAAQGGTSGIDEKFAYDGLGLRVSQEDHGSSRDLSWNRSEALPLLLGDGESSYIYGPDGLPIEEVSGEQPTYFHHDQLGSTTALTNAAGEVVGKYAYTAFGSIAQSEGRPAPVLGYAGQFTNGDSGLQYLRARVYDPSTGQFLTGDPQQAQTRSPYSYSLNNPTNLSDPRGLGIAGEIIDAGEQVVKAGSHVALNLAALPPYLVYYGANRAAHEINELGKRLGLPGEVVAHLLNLGLTPDQIAGLSGDAIVDLLKDHVVGEESICDEGVRGYINPFHSFVPPSLRGPKVFLPGINESGDVEIEW